MSNEPNRSEPPSRIPEFSSIEEEAEWWDTHDITDYLDELRPVQLRVSPNFSSVHAVKLDREDWRELTRRASEQGIGPEMLARLWIRERLRQREPAGQPSS